MNPWAIVAGLLAAAAACAYSYSAGREHQAAQCQAASARERQVAQIAVDAAASAAARAIAAIKVQHRTVAQEIQREIVDRPVYRDAECSHSAEQLQRINAALTGASAAESAGGGVLP